MQSSLRFYLKSTYLMGTFHELLLLCAGAVLFGLLPHLLLFSWSVYYARLAGDSVQEMLSIAVFIMGQAVFLTFSEKILEWFADHLGIKQATKFRSFIFSSLSDSPKAIKNLDQQKAMDPDLFFTKSCHFFKNVCRAVTEIAGTCIFLARYGFLMTGLSVLVMMCITDFCILFLTTAPYSWSLASLLQRANTAESRLRGKLSFLQMRSALLQGQKPLFQTTWADFQQDLGMEYWPTMRAILLRQKILEAFVYFCEKLVQPLMAVIIIMVSHFKFPLAEHSVWNRGVHAGVFQQVLFCFTQLWRAGSLIKNNFKDISAITSAYNNLSGFMDVVPIKKLVSHADSQKLSFFWVLQLNAVLMLVVWTMATVIVSCLQQYGLLVLTADAFVPPSFGIALMVALIIGYGVRMRLSQLKHYFPYSLSSSILALAISAISTYIWFGLSSVPMGALFYQNWALAVYTVISFIGAVLSVRYVRDISKKACMSSGLVGVVASELFKNIPLVNKRSGLTHVRLQDIGLYSVGKQGEKTPILQLSHDTVLDFPGGQSHLITGASRTGKSLLCVAPLQEGFSVHGNGILSGKISTPGDISIVLPQGGIMQDLDSFGRGVIFCQRGKPSLLLTPLQKLFYLIVCSNPQDLQQKDMDLICLWKDFEKDLFSFLKVLDFSDAWLVELRRGAIPEMSGGRKAQLFSAILHTALGVPLHQPHRRVMLCIDNGFEGIDEATLPIILQSFQKRLHAVKASVFVGIFSKLDGAALQYFDSHRDMSRTDNTTRATLVTNT